SNLLIMVIVGGYETFVSRLGIDNHPDEPEWLDHVNAGVLKVKLSMALIGISSIHLLKTFIDADQRSEHTIMWQVIIHVAFLLSAVAMAWVDRMVTHPHPAAGHGASGGAAEATH
ncbi:MAG TPA: TIGR00645 family protein, partial [Cupriavidus sp.]|nr:TIGR00645 family protein [Cupriavidus sp.]